MEIIWLPLVGILSEYGQSSQENASTSSFQAEIHSILAFFTQAIPPSWLSEVTRLYFALQLCIISSLHGFMVPFASSYTTACIKSLCLRNLSITNQIIVILFLLLLPKKKRVTVIFKSRIFLGTISVQMKK